MRIAILSRGPRLYSTRRLRDACTARGHQPRVLNPMNLSIDVESTRPALHYKGRRVSRYEAVIPRIGASITFFGCAVVRQFEQMGVHCLNPSHAIAVSRDKLRSFQVLSRHRIGFPKTVFAKDKNGIRKGLDEVGMPAVLKLLEGTQGIGVVLVENRKVAEAVLEALQEGAKQNVLVQRFVPESRGRDIRALVCGGRVVAAMRRVAVGDEFRSNVHRGGNVEAVELDEEYQRVAVHAAQIMGLRFAGVDMLEGRDGPLIMEINSSPGLEGIERATGIDVADTVVAMIEEETQVPEVDIRQRLTLRNGYGVTEFQVAPDSELANRTIRESGLRERDAIVLSIARDSVTIPNPHPSRQILPGDVLLCYGKLLALKALVPRPPPRRKRRRRNDAAGES
ncbi:MAG: RimK family alpha-L-glutamate ligase [Planctomycetota bacterium]